MTLPASRPTSLIGPVEVLVSPQVRCSRPWTSPGVPATDRQVLDTRPWLWWSPSPVG